MGRAAATCRPEEPPVPTPPADVAHLLRRAAFGGTREQVLTLAEDDLGEIVDRLLDFSANPPDDPPPELADPEVADWRRTVALQQWWLDRMATVPAPLQEKLTLFWHGHFATGQDKVGDARDMYDQNHLLRTSGAGPFEPLVQAVSVSVAMLVYLDNEPNRRGAPNENFARELMELFTLGVNQYTQEDVLAAARAWTGHNVTRVDGRRRYRFFPEHHDDGPKRFKGEVRNWDGPEIVTRILTVDPERTTAARFIARKVWTFFAGVAPDEALLTTLTQAFLSSGLEVSALLRAVFTHPAFYAPAVRQGLVRSPVDWVVACLRATGFSARDANPQWWMRDMGQDLFFPPNVSGWRNNAAFLSATAAWARAGFARHLTWKAWERDRFLDEITARTEAGHAVSEEAAVRGALARFGRLPEIEPVSPRTLEVLTRWLRRQRGAEGPPRWSWSKWAPINLATLTMLSPDAQLA
jgi:uncharacterized protein (DUF1800 family)